MTNDTFPTSDLTIPPVADILTLVKERRDLAALHEDAAGVRQLDRVRMNILSGARLAWSYGDLLIQSVNTPGAVYSVNRAGCSCPNGVAGRASCWHCALFDTLLDMAETAADSADSEAERDEADDDDDTPPAPPSPITLTLSPSGLTLTRCGTSYTAIGPAGLGALIRALTTPATPTALGARLARERAARQAA